MKNRGNRGTQDKILVALVVAASCVRIFVCFQHNPMDYLTSDMLRHWNNGVHFPRGGYTGAGDPIGYQVYIWALYKITSGNRVLVAFASALMSVLMPWTYYRAVRDFGLNKIPALWVWALIAWTPSLLTIYHYIMMETLLLLLEGVSLWMTARYLRKGGREAFLASVVCWALACLTKPTVVPLAAICVLWSWWKKYTPFRDVAIGAALALILLVPQAIRTKHELGFFAPFGNPWLAKIMLVSGARTTYFHFYSHGESSGFQKMEFSSPSTNIRPLWPLSPWGMRRAFVDSKAAIDIHASSGERDWKQAYASFESDRAEWLERWRENLLLFLFAPSWPESDVLFSRTPVSNWDAKAEYLGRWLWAPLILVVFLLNAQQFVAGKFDLIPIAVTLFTLVLGLQNVVLTEGRYRKPVEPLLLLNLVWLFADKKERRARVPRLSNLGPEQRRELRIKPNYRKLPDASSG